MFGIGDKVFYPMYGAGYIKCKEKRSFSGIEGNFLVIELPYESNMHIFIKENDIEKIGIRHLIDYETLDEVYDFLVNEEFSMSNNWVKRYEQNVNKLKSANIFDVAYVFKGLSRLGKTRKLSLRETKMLHSAKKILSSEFALVSGLSDGKIRKIIDISIEN